MQSSECVFFAVFVLFCFQYHHYLCGCFTDWEGEANHTSGKFLTCIVVYVLGNEINFYL